MLKKKKQKIKCDLLLFSYLLNLNDLKKLRNSYFENLI